MPEPGNSIIETGYRNITEAAGEGEAGDEAGNDERIDESVLLEELLQLLVAPHPENISPVHVDVERPAHPTHQADQREHQELLGARRIIKERAKQPTNE